MKLVKLYIWLFGLGVVTATSLRFQVPHVWYWIGAVVVVYLFLTWLLFSKTKQDIGEVVFRASALESIGQKPEKYIYFYRSRRNRMLLSNLLGILVGFSYALIAYFNPYFPNVSLVVTMVYVGCTIPFVVQQFKQLNEELEKPAKVISI